MNICYVVLTAVVFLVLPGNIPAIAQTGQSTYGSGLGSLPGDVPTLFSFNATNSPTGMLGNFECFAVMPDGTTMYVNGTINNLKVSAAGNSAVMTGSAIVTGFGAGEGTFVATVNPGGPGVGALNLTTDINGDGKQASAPDRSEGPFPEKIVKGSIIVNS